MSNQPAARKDGFYLPALDGLRFVAFLMVFLPHLGPPPDLQPRFIQEALERLRSFGWLGVDLFLCLSGFLITKLLFLEMESSGRIRIAHFYVRRALRIWPLYFLACLLGFLVLPAFGLFDDPIGSQAHSRLVGQHLLAYILFLGNWSAAVHGFASGPFLGPLWTISLEEQFYIIWPPLLRFTKDRRSLLLVCAILLAAAWLSRALCYVWALPHPATLANTISRLDALLIGSAMAFLPQDSLRRLSNARASTLLALLGLALYAVITSFPRAQEMSPHLIWQPAASALAAASWLAAALSEAGPGRLLSSRAAVYCGKITYGNYVYHKFAIACVSLLLGVGISERCDLSTWSLKLTLSLALTLLFATCSYRWFERPWLLVKKRFSQIASRPV